MQTFDHLTKRLVTMWRTEFRGRAPSELAREELQFRERFEHLYSMCLKADNPWWVVIGGSAGWLRTRYTVDAAPAPQDIDDEFLFLLEAEE